MAILTVKLHGEELHRIQLENGKEYVAGRAQDAQIPLGTEKGISRQHLKFYERDGIWVCEALSKFGLIQKGSETVQVIELTEACVFIVAPYEFGFEADLAEEEKPEPSRNLPTFFQPRIGTNAPTPAEGPAPQAVDNTAPRPNNEATVAGASKLVPYFRISYPNTADDEVLKLEGDLWVAGRESDSEIPINSPHISRKHFEIARTPEGFFITDLGSSNGTKVNGNKIPSHEPTRLESGDEIRVMNIDMTFEIRDVQFNNRVDRLPVPAFDPQLMQEPAEPWYPANLPAAYEPTQYQAARPERPEKKGWRRQWRKLKKNKVRLALVVLIPILLIGSLLPDKKEEAKVAPRDPASSLSFDTLSKEQKLVVKDSFNLARSLYVGGKYALCLTELAKLHEILPQFENSKELQSFCEQGLELVRRDEERMRQQREKEEVEQRILGYVEQCKSTLKAGATIDETRLCLAPAIELSPEHNLVIEMIHSAQMHEDEKKFNDEQRRIEDAKVARGQAHFNRAMATLKKDDLLASQRALEKFVNSNYPRAAGLKEEARRQIASIQEKLKVKVGGFMEECRQQGSKSQYKAAYLACDKASKEDPSNSEAKATKDKMLKELRREMKAIYEDSVLEESLGNVDSAKEKWKKILAEDLEFNDYAKKAKSKLLKYGAMP
ncbi:MAG: FHA domain-containing protein [Bdellovibrionales bacterium]|nr:FHA domain-containing protein [Bdellovibrionales bacterium]